MPHLTVEKPRALCPTGIHTFQLVEISPLDMKSFDGTGTIERLLWRFVSDKRDPEGALYEVPVFSGFAYGNAKATLTWLLDMIRPGITKAEADHLDTDDLIGLKFEGSVKHVPSEADSTKILSKFTYLRALPTDAETLDPFYFEEAPPEIQCDWEGCETVLTEQEIKASAKRWGDTQKFCRKHGAETIAMEKVAAAEAAEPNEPFTA